MPPKRRGGGGAGNFQLPLLGAGLLMGLLGGGVGAQYLLKKKDVPPLVAPAPAPAKEDNKVIADLQAKLAGQEQAVKDAKNRKRFEHKDAFDLRKALQARNAEMKEAIKKRGRFEPIAKAQERFKLEAEKKKMEEDLERAVGENIKNEAEKKEFLKKLEIVKAVIGGKINLMNKAHEEVVGGLEQERQALVEQLAAYQDAIVKIGERAIQEIEAAEFEAEARQQEQARAYEDALANLKAKLGSREGRLKAEKQAKQDLLEAYQDLEELVEDQAKQLQALLGDALLNAEEKKQLVEKLANKAKASKLARRLERLKRELA